MSSPWLKFYPSDWRADPALRMCSLAARGLWMEMLCLMHEAAPRGSLLINGRQVTEIQLATLAGASVREVASQLAQLEAAGVFSRDDSGTIFSRRMRRDDEKAERDKANGRAGGNPNIKRGVNPPDKAQKPEARNQNPEEESTTTRSRPDALDDGWPADFRERFWARYPHKVGKADAIAKLERARKARKVTFADLMAGLDRYIRDKPPDRPWCNPSTFLHQERWTDQPAEISKQGASHGASRSGGFADNLWSQARDSGSEQFGAAGTASADQGAGRG